MTGTQLLTFAIIGLTTGAIYVGIAGGLLTIYRTSGILNFAQGAMAVWGAYVYEGMRTEGALVLPVGSIEFGSWGRSLAPALIAGLLCSALLGLLVHVLVFRPMRNAPVLGQVVASVAVMIFIEALIRIRFGPNQITAPEILPGSSVDIGGATVPLASLLLLAITVVLMVLLWLFFRFTTIGIVSRASAQNPRAVSLMGFSPDRLGAYSWTIGTTLSGFIVMLAAPATGLEATSYTLYVVPALAVLLLARLSSILVATIAGFVLGSFQSVITLVTSAPGWPSWAAFGVQDAVPFIVIIVILLIGGKRLPSRGSLGTASLPAVRIPRIKPGMMAIGILVALGALLLTSGSTRFGVITTMGVALLALSYVVITGFVGQISLAQISLAGVAAFTVSKVSTNWGMPFPVSMIFAALVAMAVGMLVGIPAFRVRGAQLAVVTVAAGVALQNFVFGNPMFTPPAGLEVPPPTLGSFSLSIREGSNIATLKFGILVLVLFVLVALLYVAIAGGDTGRAFLAVRSNERAAASAGLSVSKVKLIAFGLAGFIAGIGGCVIGYSRGQLSFVSFSIFVGMTLLAVVYLGGITSLMGAIVAGLLGPLGIIYVVLNAKINFDQYYQLIAGFSLILTAVLNPEGIAGKTRADWEKFRERRARGRTPAPPDPGPDGPAREHAVAVTGGEQRS